MGGKVAFLNEVVAFLQADGSLVDEAYDDHRYFADCVVRANDREEYVTLRNLSFLRNDGDDGIERVNDVLSRSQIRIEFHFVSGEPFSDEWGQFLNQINVKLVVPDVDLPAIHKWEATADGVGRLKHDEWAEDGDDEYIEEDMAPREAIELAVSRLLFHSIEDFEQRSTVGELSGVEYQVMYNDDHDILDRLDPYDSGS